MPRYRQSFSFHNTGAAYCVEAYGAHTGYRIGRYRRPMPGIVIGHEPQPGEIEWLASPILDSTYMAELACRAHDAGYALALAAKPGRDPRWTP